MIDHIVLAMRASPDWGLFARDYAAGIPVPPSRYFPFHDQRFSREIPQLIERWNTLSNISYFACRHKLREITDGNLAQVQHVTLTQWTRVPALLGELGEARLLLFYHDDDDWFHPALANLLHGIDVTSVDAVVFPFLRLASDVTTFTQGGRPTVAAVGRLEPFRYRYCTNNYGLTSRALVRSNNLVEHTGASETAAALSFTDLQVDKVISATSKTPCSASWLSKLPDNKAAFDRYIMDYIEPLEAVDIPAESRWIETPLREALDLFRSVCGP
jgi:hypothetical protein